MKIIRIIILFISLTSIAQNSNVEKDTSVIETEFLNYIEALKNKDFEKAIEYLPNPLFEIIPKAQMINALSNTFDSPSLDFTYSNVKILSIESPKLIEGKHYSSFTYEAIIKLRINNKQAGESAEETEMRIERNKTYINRLFGDKVKAYEDETEFFDVYEKKNGYAISNSNFQEWKFLVMDDSQILLEKILPKELLVD